MVLLTTGNDNMKKEPKELTVNGKPMWDWAKENKWVSCENGCCLFDPKANDDRTCMAKKSTRGLESINTTDSN